MVEPSDFDGRALSHGRHRVLDGMLRSDRSASGSWTIGKGRFPRRQDTEGRRGGSFADREPVSGDAERGVVMEDEFLVVACASSIWGIDEDLDRSVFGQSRMPVLHGLALGVGSFDEQPFERMRGRVFSI
jgi:hypothetical protein